MENGNVKPTIKHPAVMVVAGVLDPSIPPDDQLRATVEFLGEYSPDNGPQPPKAEVLEAMRAAHELIDLAVHKYEKAFVDYALEKDRERREAIYRAQQREKNILPFPTKGGDTTN